jgi:hypothetical protein
MQILLMISTGNAESYILLGRAYARASNKCFSGEGGVVDER